MYFLNYFRYLLYIGTYWNYRLAFFVIYFEILGEFRYQIRTTGIDDLSDSLSAKDRRHASIYQPVNFYTTKKLFSQLTDQEKKTAFLDVGCGMGRVLAVAAGSGFQRVIGIDLSEKMCRYSADIAQRLMKQKQGISIDVTSIDAFDYDIPDTVGVLFLFNPFDEIIMQGFLEQLKLSLQRQPRPIKVLYANCQCEDLWLNAGFTISYSFSKMEFLEGVVFTYQPQ